MNRNLRKLKKKIDKLYWKTNQRLYITTHCYFNKRNDFHADIYATTLDKNPWSKKSIYLFEITTLNCFTDLIIRPEWSKLKEPSKEDFITISTLNEASYTPFYIGIPYRVFTLKKFGCITEKDIKKCVKYFTRKILDMWCIWNVNINLEYEKKKKKKGKNGKKKINFPKRNEKPKI